jgi:phosphoribosyl 1,2-cyclic phosphodiesterase
LQLGEIEVEPYPVPHDAREPCQFVFCAGGRRLGLLTDTGHVTAHIVERLEGCDALALEFNHDADALLQGSYPPSVKMRVASRYGHLSNAQSAALLQRFRGGGLQWIMAMHISEQNKSSEHVRTALAPVLDGTDWAFHVAAQDSVGDWTAVA